MLGALVATGGLGVLLGLRYRVPAVLVASAAVALASVTIAHITGASPWAVLIAPIGAVAVLQCGYLGGLLVSSAAARARPLRATARREAQGHRAHAADASGPASRPVAAPRGKRDRDLASREDCLAD